MDTGNIGFDLSMGGMNSFVEMSTCDSMYLQSSITALYEVEIHHDVGTYPSPKAT